MRSLVAIALGLLAAWLCLIVVLLWTKPRGSSLTEAARLLPDMLRLVGRLATDRTVPRRVRVRLWLLLGYLALPLDLIPDFIPVLGWADDVILVCLVLRSVVRRAGPELIRRHWPGSKDGLAILWRVSSLPGSAEDEPPYGLP